jgi:pimeloyl-ACP methyl ester carboxylesterase
MKKLIAKVIGLYLNVLALLAPRKAGKLGLELFCYPLRIPISKKQLAFLTAAAQSRIDFEGVQLQVYRWGRGPKNILLLHGWQSHSYRWKAYIEAIDKHEYTIHAFDAPGHGLSTGKFLNLLFYGKVIQHVIGITGEIDCIISHSIGSFSALYAFAMNRRLSVHKIIAMACPGEVQEFMNYFKQSLRLSDTGLNVVVNHFIECFKQPPGYFSAPYFASAIDIPGLIIHDEDDTETSAVHSKRIHQSWKNSRLVITKGAGHNLKSSEVLREVIAFVNAPTHVPPTLNTPLTIQPN